MMHLPAVRKGLIPQTVCYEPYTGGMDQYGALALQSNPSSYAGVRWLYSKKKRAQCKGYDDAVKKYNKAEEDHKKNGCTKASFFGLRRGKCKPTANRMKAAEEEGKNAWKECQAYEKGEAKGYTQLDTSGGYTNVASTGSGAVTMPGVDPLTGLPIDPATGLPVGTGYETEESSGAGLWIAVGALVVATGGIVIYKRSRKKKGGKRK